jgi:predicted RNA-binding Zn-ribbon protein involved in translation (DUF1610 family)
MDEDDVLEIPTKKCTGCAIDISLADHDCPNCGAENFPLTHTDRKIIDAFLFSMCGCCLTGVLVFLAASDEKTELQVATFSSPDELEKQMKEGSLPVVVIAEVPRCLGESERLESRKNVLKAGTEGPVRDTYPMSSKGSGQEKPVS